jgi:hypothetical protein
LSAAPSPEKSPLCEIETPIVIGAAAAVGVVLPPHAANVKPRAAAPAEIKRLRMLSPSLLRTPRGKKSLF